MVMHGRGEKAPQGKPPRFRSWSLASLQGQGDPLDHRAPIAGSGLPEQPGRRIPGAVVAVLQPAPAAVEARQNPHRLAQGAARCATEVSTVMTRSRLATRAAVSAKSTSSGVQSMGRRGSGKLRPLRGGGPLLQAEDGNTLDRQQRRHLGEMQAAAAIGGAGRGDRAAADRRPRPVRLCGRRGRPA